MDINIDANTRVFLKNIKQFQKQLGNERTIKRIHRKAGKPIEAAMEAEIKDARTPIDVQRKTGWGAHVEPGTYKRSIKVWLIQRGGTSYFAGPQTGRRAAEDSDAWFQTFVESGDTYFAQLYGGTGGNRNIGAIQRAKRKAIGPALRQMKKDYEKAIARAAKAASKGKR